MELVYGETITVLRRGGRDEFGDPLGSDDYTESHTIDDVIFNHTKMGSNDNRYMPSSPTGGHLEDWVTEGNMYLPLGSDILPTDRFIRENGELGRVYGKPTSYSFGLASGIALMYRQVSGSG